MDLPEQTTLHRAALELVILLLVLYVMVGRRVSALVEGVPVHMFDRMTICDILMKWANLVGLLEKLNLLKPSLVEHAGVIMVELVMDPLLIQSVSCFLCDISTVENMCEAAFCFYHGSSGVGH